MKIPILFLLSLFLVATSSFANDWTVKTKFDGAKKLAMNFSSLRIGTAEYVDGPTGCTVFYFPKGAQCAVDQRGGFSGTFMLGDGYVDAICYAGGSLLGVEASAGVAKGLFERRKSHSWYDIPVVRGAIIYDFLPRANLVYPDVNLGKIAFNHAEPNAFYIGRHGAGSHASVGVGFDPKYAQWGGQGGAFRQVDNIKIAAFIVCNSLGAIHGRDGGIVAGNTDRKTGEKFTVAEDVEKRIQSGQKLTTSSGRTTLLLIVTNLKLDQRELRSLARQVNAAMGRVIQPLAAFDDGDVTYAVTTNEVSNNNFGVTALGVLASELAWDATLSIFDE
ncbi:MAG: 6-aminohexanoate hydrolase [Euryarchaeota archaeon]|nr:6-aminohexanoate hydrolase [Euryarchaeota archaeon]